MPQSPSKHRSRKSAAGGALNADGAQALAALVPESHLPMESGPLAHAIQMPDSSEMRGTLERILARFVPAHVVIDSKHEVRQFQGNAGRYLELAPGRANLNLLSMLRHGLSGPLRATLRIARQRGTSVRKQNVQVHTNDGVESINIEVTPLQVGEKPMWFVIVFEAAEDTLQLRRHLHQTNMAGRTTSARSGSQMIQLREELARLRESLRMAVVQQEVTNGELKLANEDVQSANEELQSINEELETSREQLQSSNDQLLTVNEALLQRAVELAALNSELSSLLSSANIAALVVDTDMRIKCFTAAAESTFKLIRGDVGRPLNDLNLGIACPDLGKRLQEVLATGESQTLDARDKCGKRYSMRLHPYITEEKQIDGVAIVTVDLG